MTRFQKRSVSVHSLLGLEVLAILFAMAIIAACVVSAELLKRPLVADACAPKQQSETSAKCEPPHEVIKYVYVNKPQTAQPFGGYPTIALRETDGFSFLPGKAELSTEFTQLLDDNIGKILELARSNGADRLEIVGHTDEQPLRANVRSNLDKQLFSSLAYREDEILTASDNVGLGMNRAVSVVRYLKRLPQLASFNIVPLSAGPLINTTGGLSNGSGGSDASRRRIEIRLLRLQYNQGQ